MDSTPIYTELQHTLIDPEDDNWAPSAPPEFASSLAGESDSESGSETRKATPRTGGRRRRAED
ncbi:hypothetical protein GIY23_05590 [Allosaccharopolyspora coralli]|uniref:Uncharacterized protein n=1 Tax=Allosaccharopolyspora coralli TaxID=2665642 RepID=A0A5Q3Q3A6_9PSEU|nr:hypothetical protein [Allosaccharopolyspora coralli]QGK69078.1 hypothetical protein GIY23_05590 [Allosaccharopolyspora coralli]